MLHTRLGNTNLIVSRLGLGLAALGRPGYINIGHDADLEGRRSREKLEAHARKVMDEALAAGITYFDVARSYGDGEAFLGRWLKDGDPGVTVASKWGYRYVADWRTEADVHEVKDHSVDHLRHQHGETETRIGGHLRVYQIHSATLESGVLEDDSLLDELSRLQETGIAIGLSTSGPQQHVTIEKAAGIRRSGERLFATVQCTWNLLEDSATAALAAAHAEGMGVVVKEAVANGRLTARDPDASALLAHVAPGYPPDAVAIAAALAQPWADVVLSGAATPDQLRSNICALDVPSAAIASLPPMSLNPTEYWNARSQLPWN